MRQSGRVNRAAALLLAASAGLPLAACGSSPDGSDTGSTIGNLIGFNSTKAPPIKDLPNKGMEVECPDVTVADGQASFRTYAGADKSGNGVKHQFSFGEIARECFADEGKLSIRIGVSGYVLAGPAGGPGSFQVPVKITIRREGGSEELLQSKAYKIAAVIPPGETKAGFSFVTDSFVLPLVHTDANLDYLLKVGFDGSPDRAERPQKVSAKRKAQHQ